MRPRADLGSSDGILPDVLAPGLDIVFCGTAAGAVSAARGCYYAHPQNKFWRALHAVGLTPRRLAPEEFAGLPNFGLGLTDIAKSVCGMDKQLPAGSLGRAACEAMAVKIVAARPRILAFTSLNAGRRYLRREARLGEQPERDESWWHVLARATRGQGALRSDHRALEQADPIQVRNAAPIHGHGVE
jgi:TDG/mug DNA glycosylase family protein